jgi:hypothetical protein
MLKATLSFAPSARNGHNVNYTVGLTTEERLRQMGDDQRRSRHGLRT